MYTDALREFNIHMKFKYENYFIGTVRYILHLIMRY